MRLRLGKQRLWATAVVIVLGLGITEMRIGGPGQMVALAAGAEGENPATQFIAHLGELEMAQQEAEKALETAQARIEQGRLKLWSFDEEKANRVLVEAEQALARSYAASGAANADQPSGVTVDDPEVLAWQAKELADSVSKIVVDSRAAEARGVWIDKDILGYMSDPDMLRRLLQRLAETNINVVYVLAYDMGETIYPSPYAIVQNPRFKDWEEDPLKVIVDEAHRYGMEVQAWIGVFIGGYSGKPGPLLTAHPDWADETRSGKKVSRYGTLVVNPSVPQAQEHLLDVIGDLVRRYEVDGIQLDYARYEENGTDDFGYHPYSVELFRKQYGVDPHTISRSSPLWQTWVKWRQDQVTEFVRRVRQRLEEIRPGTLLSVAAEPIVEAASLRFQDWVLWAKEGIVDQVVPMDYVRDVAKFRQWAELDAAALRDARGIYWYEGIGQFGLSDQETVERIELNRQLGADGTVLWSVVSMKMDTYRMLKEGPWRLPAILPTGRPGATEAAVAALLNRLADRLEEVYLAKADATATASRRIRELVQRLRETATAAGVMQPTSGDAAQGQEPAALKALESRVGELQELVNELDSAGAATGKNAQLILAPETVEALRNELGYVRHLIVVGLSRAEATR